MDSKTIIQILVDNKDELGLCTETGDCKRCVLWGHRGPPEIQSKICCFGPDECFEVMGPNIFAGSVDTKKETIKYIEMLAAIEKAHE